MSRLLPCVAILALALSMNARAACDASEARQFDFWLGDWEVVGAPESPATGQLQGHNSITRVADGCARMSSSTIGSSMPSCASSKRTL